MKINSNARPIIFNGDDGFQLRVSPSNMGEPYRDGIDFSLISETTYSGGFLEKHEAERLHKFLGEYLNNTITR